jgi:hypothetical protein
MTFVTDLFFANGESIAVAYSQKEKERTEKSQLHQPETLRLKYSNFILRGALNVTYFFVGITSETEREMRATSKSSSNDMDWLQRKISEKALTRNSEQYK